MLWHSLVTGHQQEQCWLQSFIYYSQSVYGYELLCSTFSDHTNIFRIANEILKYIEAFLDLIPTYITRSNHESVWSTISVPTKIQ